MKVLSTRLAMYESYSVQQFQNTIVKWLKGGAPSKEVGEKFEKQEFGRPMTLKAGYCTLEVFTLKKGEAEYNACRLTHIYREQTWVSDIILKTTLETATVYININCLGDTTQFDEIPTVRTEVIREFVQSGDLKGEELPITVEPLMLTQQRVGLAVDVINGVYRGSLPVVYVSKFFNSAGHVVDVQRLAKDLSGIAIVIAEEDDNYLETIKEQTNRNNPFNGHIGLYYPNAKGSNIYRPSDWKRYGSINSTIQKDVARYTTAQTDAEGVSWEQLHGEIIANQAKESEELLNETINENGTLEEQLREAKEKLHRAVQENKSLALQNENLIQALNGRNEDNKILRAAPIEEFFCGEQYDLVVTILERAMKNTEPGTRKYELLKGLLAENEIQGDGKAVDDTLKRILSKGENIRERDLLELKDMGFEVIADSTHYRLIYKGNEKYVITLYKTPSDGRSGKNLVSDILNNISIYR